MRRDLVLKGFDTAQNNYYLAGKIDLGSSLLARNLPHFGVDFCNLTLDRTHCFDRYHLSRLRELMICNCKNRVF